MRTRSFPVRWAAAGVLFLIAGCCATDAVESPGSSHVAVLSVTSWDDYKGALSPAFDLTAKDAVALSIPDTRQFESALLDAFRGEVRVRVAPSAVLAEGFGAPTAPAGSPAGTPPSLPGVTASGAPVEPAALPGEVPRLAADAAMPSFDKLRGDPTLQYLAGTALFQEVKLLERYVADAPRREGFAPFIVRLQIANQPFGDDKAYDVFTNIAFFMDPIGTDAFANRIAAEKEKLTTATASMTTSRTSVELSENALKTATTFHSRLFVLAQLELARQMRKQAETEKERSEQAIEDTTAAKLRAERDASVFTPIVVPLLVTDQIESALISGRAEELRQLTFSLAAAYAGIGGKVDLEKVDQLIEKSAGRSYRSTFTVGRLANNMLRVRIAARSTPELKTRTRATYGYETVARTHNVTLLVLVPESKLVARGEAQELPVYLATRSEFRRPDTGAKFPASVTKEERTNVAARAETFINDRGYGRATTPTKFLDADLAHQLLAFAQGNDYEHFMEEATKLYAADEARRLFMDLVIAKIGVDFDSTQFHVRIPARVDPTLGGTAGVYGLDNGESLQLTADGVPGVEPLRVSATWSGVKPAGTMQAVSLAALAVERRGRSQLVLTFPSLLKLGLVPKGGRIAPGSDLTLTAPGLPAAMRPVVSVVFAGTPVDAPALAINHSTSRLQATGDQATTRPLTLGFVASAKAVPDPAPSTRPSDIAAVVKAQQAYVIAFDGAGAELAGTSEAVMRIPNVPGAFLVVGTGEATFDLSHLIAGTKVTLKVTPPAGGQAVAPIVFDVGPPPPTTAPAPAAAASTTTPGGT